MPDEFWFTNIQTAQFTAHNGPPCRQLYSSNVGKIESISARSSMRRQELERPNIMNFVGGLSSTLWNYCIERMEEEADRVDVTGLARPTSSLRQWGCR
jgi:hypothetical protein